jgi:hypothetical protein
MPSRLNDEEITMNQPRKKAALPGRIPKKLLGCLAAILLFFIVIAVISQLTNRALRSSQLYKLAVIRVKTYPAVVEAFGLPMRDGWFVRGSIRGTGSSSQAELTFPISGPKGRTVVYVQAEKSAGKWTYSTLQVKIRGDDTKIDLLQPVGS